MTRGSTIALALGLSGFIAGGSIASMALFSSKRAAPSTHIIIAEPASITMGPAAALPTATFIDFTSEPAIRSPKGGFLVKIPADKFELDFKTATLDEDAEGGVPLPRRKPSAGIKLASTVAGLEAFSSREETITLQPFMPSLDFKKRVWPESGFIRWAAGLKLLSTGFRHLRPGAVRPAK